MMECGVELQGGVDLHAAATEGVCGFGSIEEAEREMWLNSEQEDLLGVNDASMFYADFPPLPDFPCMSSSSSSSSSTPSALAVKTIITCSTTTTNTTTTTTSSSSSASSSSAASWAVLKSDVEEDATKNSYMQQQQHHRHLDLQPLCSTASMEISQQYQFQEQQQQQQEDPGLGGTVGECMDDVMDTFGYMELLEANDFFDPASIFQHDAEFESLQDNVVPLMDENLSRGIESVQKQTEEENNNCLQQEVLGVCCNNNNNKEEEMMMMQGRDNEIGGGDDEMSTVFLEWLKSNKDSVSADDLRNVKLKKSTIESAARRLGGGKEAMKQLLKLILEWVQTSHLQSKRRKDNNHNLFDQTINNNNGSFVPESNTNNCFNQTTPWISSQPTFGTDQGASLMMTQPSFTQPMLGFVGDIPYTNNCNTTTTTNNPYQNSEYHMQIESAHSWPPSQFNVGSHFGDNSNLLPATAAPFGYGNQYPYQFFHGAGDRLMRLGPSATKEARKKRMARQRRLLSHHNRHHHGHLGNQVGGEAHARLGGDNCTNAVAAPQLNPANWMYWQSMAGGAASLAPVVPTEVQPGQQMVDRPAMQAQNCQPSRVAQSDRRQGWKPEKNLRFLLQKVLKQSDVGSLGRIVLPKKEAETHLPELEARDGISITMEDIGTSRVWNMRYRYWPNNKSRMYLLENTGDFVRANGLQEGDFIVIYSDVKCGKFMIRGVKVRQQQVGAKPESKKSAAKSQKNQHGINAAVTPGASSNNATSKKLKNLDNGKLN